MCGGEAKSVRQPIVVIWKHWLLSLAPRLFSEKLKASVAQCSLTVDVTGHSILGPPKMVHSWKRLVVASLPLTACRIGICQKESYPVNTPPLNVGDNLLLSLVN